MQGMGGVLADRLIIEPMTTEQIAAILRGFGNLLKTEETGGEVGQGFSSFLSNSSRGVG